MATRILVNLSNTGFVPSNSLPAYWNNALVSTVGVMFADMVDSLNATTGISMSVGVGSAFTKLDSSGAGGGDYFGYDELAWESTWYCSGDDDTFVLSGFAPGQTGTIEFAGWVTVGRNTRIRASSGDVQDWVASARPPNALSSLAFTADGSGNITLTNEVVSSLTYVTLMDINFTTATGPTITGPASTTEAAATVAAGTLLDTVTIFSLISGTFSIEQTIDSSTATTLNYVAESGANVCVPATPVSGVPLADTISAAGVTPYQVQQEADDETNPPATFNITLNGEATHEVVQTMIAVANTTPGESIFGTDLIVVENDMQAYVIKVVNGMTITWADDGTFTTDADQTETIDVVYFSASTGQWSCLSLTIKDTSIIQTSGILQPVLSSPLSDVLSDVLT